ncbi:MAG: sel1 repeat family protein [Proteobacteria bacterium]|nr:sel1 repeat family protein [Pseudomonadota bacterium]
MQKKYLSILMGILIAASPMFVSCSKKEQPAEQPAETAAPTEAPAPDAQTAPAAEETAPAAEEQPAPKEPEEPAPNHEEIAQKLFDESNPEFDFSKGCEELRKLDKYESPEMLYRRAWCDHTQGLTIDEAVKEQTIARLKEAGEKNYPQALTYLNESGIDTSGVSYMRLIEILRDRIKTEDTPENQYLLASALMSLPTDVTKEVIDLFEKSAKAEYLPAMEKLGFIQITRENKKDKAKGLALLEKAVSLGSADAALDLVSQYDFETREAKKPQAKNEKAKKLLDYCEKSVGKILTCRSELDVANEELIEPVLRERALNALPACIESINSRSGCDILRNDLNTPAAKTLPKINQKELHQSLIKCYQNVIRHGDERLNIAGQLQPTNQQIIDELKSITIE